MDRYNNLVEASKIPGKPAGEILWYSLLQLIDIGIYREDL